MAKVTLSTGSLYHFGLNRIFKIAAEAGYQGLELILRSESDCAYADTWDVKYIKSLEKKHGIRVYSLHLPFEIEASEEPELILSNAKKLAASLGITNIVLHTPREDQQIYLKWFKARNWKKEGSAKVCVENLWSKEGKPDPIYNNPKEFKIFPNLCFDISHSLRDGIDPDEFFKQLPSIRNVHCSYWNGKKDHLSIQEDPALYQNIFAQLPENVEIIATEIKPSRYLDIFDESNITKFLKKECDIIKSALNHQKD